MAKYEPPKQSKAGQIFDVVVLLALIIGALRLPLWFDLAGGSKTAAPVDANATWQTLGQDTPEKIAAWNALGFTDPKNEALQNIITARYDYTINYVELAIMVIVVVGYFFMVIRFSDKEYREVIDEKFGGKK